MGESLLSSKINGWRLFNCISITVLLMVFAIVFTSADLVNGLRVSIRATARSSFILFIVSFIASGLVSLVPATLTKYLIINRKFFGLAFAFSHFVHAVLIGFYAWFSEGYRSSFSVYDNSSGFVGYIFIILMTITSFKPARRLTGETNWRVLHTFGMWVLAYVFWRTNYELLSEGIIYVIFLNVMSAAIVLQLLGKVAKRVRRNASTNSVYRS
ncbi:ferric reductase-like transmembrane domain-containing protein [Raoultella terrigena]|uniref:ferric reductase-like transmembrane domain-containing protein n=1 Tax=Raoultella terrigena TaxID=577 RepID=UPI001F5278D5|nr:ferric reductase-like transmembrane domain-containing protein [Raoultella terrigena]MCI1034748.1 ferric reductase-like transmembrane domain-containing protein [Raoultella terrigena]